MATQAVQIYHIRRPLRRAGGNSFYRDKSDRFSGCFCEVERDACTAYDIPAAARAETWVDLHGVAHVPCVPCVVEREKAAWSSEKRPRGR